MPRHTLRAALNLLCCVLATAAACAFAWATAAPLSFP